MLAGQNQNIKHVYTILCTTGMPEIVLTLFYLDFVAFPFIVARNVIKIFLSPTSYLYTAEVSLNSVEK